MNELSPEDRDLLKVYLEVNTPSEDEVADARAALEGRLGGGGQDGTGRRVPWLVIGAVTLLAAACALFFLEGGGRVFYAANDDAAVQEAEYGEDARGRNMGNALEAGPARPRAGVEAGRSKPAPEPEPDLEPEPEPDPPVESTLPEQPATPVVRSKKRERPPKLSADGPADATLSAELTLLRPAQRAVRQRNFARALELLANHAGAFPKSALGQERLLARLEALCGLGRQDDANKAAAAFATRYPRSHLRERVSKTCAE